MNGNSGLFVTIKIQKVHRLRWYFVGAPCTCWWKQTVARGSMPKPVSRGFKLGHEATRRLIAVKSCLKRTMYIYICVCIYLGQLQRICSCINVSKEIAHQHKSIPFLSTSRLAIRCMVEHLQLETPLLPASQQHLWVLHQFHPPPRWF